MLGGFTQVMTKTGGRTRERQHPAGIKCVRRIKQTITNQAILVPLFYNAITIGRFFSTRKGYLTNLHQLHNSDYFVTIIQAC